MKGSIGLSVWKASRKGRSTLATVMKNCSFASVNGSLTYSCKVVKLWLFGILDLGPTLIWSTYVFISAHNMTALSAIGTSSNHLVAQNFNVNFFAVASFLKSSLFAGNH